MNGNSEIKALVLDDDPFILKVLCRMLKNEGIANTATCEDGESALGYINGGSEQPNLILCDLNMPHMDGIEFMRMLVDHHYTGSVILISGENERVLQSVELLVHAHKITVLGHLCKPVSVEGLSALLKKWERTKYSSRELSDKVYTADELRYGIQNSELINYYQPKVLLKTGRVVGMETLVRWRHPTGGLVLPDQFISIAEEHGLIDALTESVLKMALAQTRLWHDAGVHLKIAVNVSMDNLAALDFPALVIHLTTQAGVEPADIVLEVTESRLMKDQRASLETLTRLRLKRFCLSIDDFGTGHSSLVQLRDIPFDELKIDRSFVHDAHANETIRAIYRASVSMASQLDMTVVAEGVEDQDDWDFLRGTGCDMAQGYYISRPMPAEDVLGWVERWHQNSLQLHSII